MKRNFILILFLSIVAVGLLFYTASAMIRVYEYSRFTQRVSLSEIKWSTKCFAEDVCSPQADYSYLYQGMVYQGQTLFSKQYLNEWSATEASQRMNGLNKAWINPIHPNESTMEKQFPLKSVLYTAILWALLLYFILLWRYMLKNHYK